MNLALFIRDPEAYLAGNFHCCFTVVEDRERWEALCPEWVFCNEIQADDVDIADVTQAAVTELDEEITKVRAESQVRLDALETRKANLLAITHQPEESE